MKVATAVDGLRSSITTWFNFYNGYDPLFTWWMGMPFKEIDGALQGYAAFLRDTVAPADLQVAAAAATPIPPAPSTPLSDVPDLQEIIALPQDEMTGIVQRFVNPGGQAGGRGGRGATNNPGGGQPRQYYLDWLEALKTLDFDRLSRNAQVDYLFIRRTAETQLARANLELDPNPPRKPDNSGIAGPARGRAGLLQDLAEAMIPYTPEELIALAEKEFAWCDREMLKASRRPVK